MGTKVHKNKSQPKEVIVIMKALLTVISQMIGGSIVAVPSLFHSIGLLISVILMVSGASISLLNYHFMIILSHKFKCTSYRELLSAVVNKKIAMINDILIIIQFIGVMTSYIIVASTCFQSFLINVTGQENNAIINNIIIWKVVITLGVILPLCFIKTLNILGYIATFGFIFILMVGFTVVAYFFVNLGNKFVCLRDEKQYGHYDLVIIPKMEVYMQFLKFLMYVPAIQGYFCAQNIIPQLMSELPHHVNKILTVRIAVFTSVCLSLALYIVIGITGSMMFGNDSNDNVLVAFQPCKLIWVNICMILNAFVVIVVFPLLIYPIKANVVKWSGNDPSTKKGMWIMVGVTMLFVILPLILSLALQQILTVLGLFGSISGCIMFFIGPILLILYAKRPYDMRDYEQERQKKSSSGINHQIKVNSRNKFITDVDVSKTKQQEISDNQNSSAKLLKTFGKNKYIEKGELTLPAIPEESSHLYHDGPQIVQKDGWETIPVVKQEEDNANTAKMERQVYQKYPPYPIPKVRKALCYSMLALAVTTCMVASVMNIRQIINPNL